MFSRCRIVIIKGPIIPYRDQERGYGPKNDKMDSVNPPTIAPVTEATDMYRQIAIEGNPIAAATMNEIGERAISVPIPVATPFPPLNLRKTDHVCPISVANPQLIISKSSNPKLG